MKCFRLFFLTKSLKSGVCFILKTSHFQLATFQVLSSHLWLSYLTTQLLLVLEDQKTKPQLFSLHFFYFVFVSSNELSFTFNKLAILSIQFREFWLVYSCPNNTIMIYIGDFRHPPNFFVSLCNSSPSHSPGPWNPLIWSQ